MCTVCPDSGVSDGEPASNKHGRAAYLSGVFGSAGASQGSQYEMQTAAADTHSCGDPYSRYNFKAV